MADWEAEIRLRLASLGLTPAREAEITEELSQHLKDRTIAGQLVERGWNRRRCRTLVRSIHRSLDGRALLYSSSCTNP
jgi:hypothetical protein